VSRRVISSPLFKQSHYTGSGQFKISRPELHLMGEDEPRRKPSIKVIGVGGAGCNAIADSPFNNIAVCTALEDTRAVRLESRVLVTSEHVDFMKETSFKTVRSIKYEFKDWLEGAVGEPDIAFIFAGLGGDTGSYIAPVVADICKKRAGLCISSVALPFSVEGKDRRCVADCSMTKVYQASDIAITYPNDHLLKMVPNLPLGKAFNVMNRIMMVPLLELEKVLTVGDLEVLRRNFTRSNSCRLGVGTGTGDFGELRALEEAITSPWFDFDRDRVMSALVTISSGEVEEEAVRRVLDELAKRIPYSKIDYAGICDKDLGAKYKVMLVLGIA
jgi:cell division protein FtsZ